MKQRDSLRLDLNAHCNLKAWHHGKRLKKEFHICWEKVEIVAAESLSIRLNSNLENCVFVDWKDGK